MPITDHRSFQGSAAQLTAAAQALAPEQGLAAEKINERLVRYYVGEGVVDRPERLGREARYGYRHLLQFLTARRLTEAGLGLTLVAKTTQEGTTKALEAGLTKSALSAAQLLVQQFQARQLPLVTGEAAGAPAVRRKPAASIGLPDVKDELQRLRHEVQAQARQLQRLEERQLLLINRLERVLQWGASQSASQSVSQGVSQGGSEGGSPGGSLDELPKNHLPPGQKSLDL